ncbi:MAG: hypothetical protein Tsb0010_02740 [Parvularculaceae bacterium]
MADGRGPGKGSEILRPGKVFRDQAEAALRVEMGAVKGGDPDRFLTAMLQCVQSERGDWAGIGDPEYADDPAFFREGPIYGEFVGKGGRIRFRI